VRHQVQTLTPFQTRYLIAFLGELYRVHMQSKKLNWGQILSSPEIQWLRNGLEATFPKNEQGIRQLDNSVLLTKTGIAWCVRYLHPVMHENATKFIDEWKQTHKVQK
jgi:hypothetical protein